MTISTAASRTQCDVVLDDLRAREWTCGTVWLRGFIPRYPSRINDLKNRGHVIASRRCEQHEHRGGVAEYRLVYDADRPRTLF